MEMINVLNTIPANELGGVILVFLVALGMSFLCLIILKDSVAEIVSGICCVLFAIGLLVTVSLSTPETYECTIKPDAKAIEFINTFNITEQRGEIFKVTLKAKPE